MCGRFTLRTPPGKLVDQFELDAAPELTPRYNIAPTQQIPVIRQPGSQRELVFCRWGLIPSGVAEAGGPPLINARSETAASKPSFREAMRRRRCLIPADGFFEWRAVGKRKQPYFIEALGSEIFAFAGLWERWEGAGQIIESCTILTTAANELLRELHDRMPVILAPADYAAWLNCREQTARDMAPLLKPLSAERLTMTPVSSRVNSADNDDPACLAPPAERTLFPDLF